MARRRLTALLAAAIGAALFLAPEAHAGPLIVVAVMGAAFAATTAGVVAGFVISAVLSVALSFVARALTKPAASTIGSSTSGTSQSSSRVTIDQKQTVKQATAPRRVIYGRTRVGGIYGFLYTRNTNQSLFGTVMLAGHQIFDIPYVLFDDEAVVIDAGANVVSGRYAGFAQITKHFGEPGQQADGMLMINCPEVWDASRQGNGIAYFAFHLEWDNQSGLGDVGSKIWTGGIPNMTAVVDGKIVYDPRSDSYKHTPNAALVIADYLTDEVYGVGASWDAINIPALIAAANVCDEFVLSYEGGPHYVNRYTINGQFLSDAQPDAILGQMAAAMHGSVVYDGIEWTIIPGAYQFPEYTLTDDDAIESSTLDVLTSGKDAFNSVKGTFVSDASLLMPAGDFPSITSEGFRELDGGIFREKDIELPFTTNINTAQRIAKIDLFRMRQEIVETFVGRPYCWRSRVGDTVYRTSARYGWTNKPFEVANVRFVSRKATDTEGDGPILAVELTLMETTPTIFDWDISEENITDYAPNTNLPDIFNVLPPGAITAYEELYVARQGGGVKSQLVVSWGQSPDAFVVGYVLQYKLATDDDWTSRGQVATTSDTVPDLAPGEYDLRVFAVNWARIQSDASATKRVSVYGVLAPPGTPQNLSLVNLAGFAVLRWDQADELDVLEGGSVIIRHSTQITPAPTWADATSISEPLPGRSTMAVVPARLGTYMLKFRDGSGNYSLVPALVLGFQNGLFNFTALGEAIEEPAFAGAMVNVARNGAVITLVPPPGILLDDVPSIDALTSFDRYAVGFPDGVYSFANGIDLGSVQQARLTSFMTSLVYATNDLIDNRSTMIDTWSSVDGTLATGDEADATFMVRSTNADPATAPTWSPWARLDAGEFNARAFQFQIVFHRTSESVTIQATAAGVIAEALTP